MADHPHDAQPSQLTQPKGIDPKTGKPYEPIEIPAPKRKDIEDLLDKAATAIREDRYR
jgi:hypothetical protein